ncbi:MAG: AI-2E family transporter [Erysipelotrichia bacterium]|nr:AI-2E family transporter [Erysipelotrichia bacterium]NCC55260.1 AI-2E family transporter [Erysipelotrichia bacterium]
MKDFIKENKNQLLVCTYVIVVAVIILNFKLVFSFTSQILSLLKPLFVAIAIAFVLNIPMSRIERSLKKIIKKDNFLYRFIRTFSIIITLILAVILLYLLLIIIVPKVSESLQLVFSHFGDLVNATINSINGIFKDLKIDFKLQDIAAVKEIQNLSWSSVFEQTLSVLSGVADGFISNAVAFTNGFLEGFLAFCLSLYLLGGKEGFIYQSRKVIISIFSVKRSQRIFDIGKQANFIFTKFVGGQLVDCAIKGIMFYIVFKLLNFPMPELSSAIITVCSIVPVFGPMFAMFIDFILIFAFSPMAAIWFVIIFQVLSNLESQIIYPRIVGKSIGLPGIWVLLSIFVLGGQMGITGMILAVPITALLYTLFTDFINHRLQKKNIRIVEDKIMEGYEETCED